VVVAKFPASVEKPPVATSGVYHSYINFITYNNNNNNNNNSDSDKSNVAYVEPNPQKQVSFHSEEPR
jgi:hypothetical protein